MTTHNWAGNVEFDCDGVHEPINLDELCALVRDAGAAGATVRAVGTGHSFNQCANPQRPPRPRGSSISGGVLVSLRALPDTFALDRSSSVVRCSAGATIEALNEWLASHPDSAGTNFPSARLALPALPSLPHVTIAGALCTATHGSGLACGSLASLLVGCVFVDDRGELVDAHVDDEGSAHLLQAVLLGGCGLLVELSLRCVPAFNVRQDVYGPVPWAATEMAGSRANSVRLSSALLGAGDSVSLFTHWLPDPPAGGVEGGGSGHGSSGTRVGGIHQAWIKRRTHAATPTAPAKLALPVCAPADADGRGACVRVELLSGGARPTQVHPCGGTEDASNVSAQGEPAGPSHHRLTHFRPDAPPSLRGAELQTEYYIRLSDAEAAQIAQRSRDDGDATLADAIDDSAESAGPTLAVQALRAVRALSNSIEPALRVCEIRTVGPDWHWLSPTYGWPGALGLHFTWRHDEPAVLAVLPALEAALLPLGARPHWGKLFVEPIPRMVVRCYGADSAARYAGVVAQCDASGLFRNAFLDEVLQAAAADRAHPHFGGVPFGSVPRAKL
jgi:xylitol oxidase